MTYGAIVEGRSYEADRLISIRPDLEELTPLVMELGLPQWSVNTSGKVLIDKQPDGALSPNLADAVMIAFQPSTRMIETWIKCAG